MIFESGSKIKKPSHFKSYGDYQETWP